MSMVRLAQGVAVTALILMAAGCCKSNAGNNKPAPTATGGGGADPKTAALLGALGKAVGCPSTTAGHRDFCIATDGWATGTPGTLPSGNAMFAGLAIVVEEGKTPNPTADIKPSLLVMRSAGNARWGKIFTPTPDSPDESADLATFVFNTSAVFKGKASQAAVPAPLYNYAMTQAAAANYPLTQDSTGWTLAGKASAEIRRVGQHWVAIEQDPSGRGIYVNVLTDKVMRK